LVYPDLKYIKYLPEWGVLRIWFVQVMCQDQSGSMILNKKQTFSVFRVMMLAFCKEYIPLFIFSLKLLDKITKQIKKE